MHKSDGTVCVFKESDKVLCYMDTKTQHNNNNIDVTLVNTVDNKHVQVPAFEPLARGRVKKQ